MDTQTTEILICKCGDTSHQCVIQYWDDDHALGEVYLSVHLDREANIFRRIWYGLKYIFGKPSVYGDFDEIILRPEDAPKLQKVVDYLKNSKDGD